MKSSGRYHLIGGNLVFSFSPEEDEEDDAHSEPGTMPELDQNTVAEAPPVPEAPGSAAIPPPVVVTYDDAWVLCQALPEARLAVIRRIFPPPFSRIHLKTKGLVHFSCYRVVM